jgi:two-component system sensor histidine kinase MtrB
VVPDLVHIVPVDAGVEIRVEDAGPGVPAEIRDDLFEAFRRGPASNGLPGTGVGLSLVARFAELHGGRATVTDRDGGGASFRVFFPSEEAGDQPMDPQQHWTMSV